MANEAQLADRAGAVQKQLSDLSGSMTLKQTLTMVLGFGLLAGVAAFYWYGYSQVKPLLEPKTMVDAGMSMALKEMPNARSEAVAFAKQQLPELAQFASNTALEQLPNVREQAENMLLAGADEGLKQLREPLKAHIQAMVQKNKKTLADGAVELTKSSADADKYLKTVSAIAEKDLGADLDETVGMMSNAAVGFGDTLANAAIDSAKRSNLQVMLREMLMLSKRLSIEMTESMDQTELKEAHDFVKPVLDGAKKK